jgi:hypothetical protein
MTDIDPDYDRSYYRDVRRFGDAAGGRSSPGFRNGHGLPAVLRAAGPVSFKKNVKAMANTMP